MYTCPCCGYEICESQPGAEICPICFWEEDAWQLFFPFDASGANHCCLAQAQVSFVQLGACDHSVIEYVRSPSLSERKDPQWFPLWERQVSLANHETETECFPLRFGSSAPDALCYWLRPLKTQGQP